MSNFAVLLFAGQSAAASEGARKDCTEKDIIAAVTAAEQGDNLFTFPDEACRTGAKCFADCPLICKNDIITEKDGKAYCDNGEVVITQPRCKVDPVTSEKYGNGVSCMGGRFPSCNDCDADWCDASFPDEECKFENGVCTEKNSVKTIDGKKCIFPFIYRGKTYKECAKVGASKFWCATRTTDTDQYMRGKWNYCEAAAGSITANTTSAPPAPPAPPAPGAGGYEEVLDGYEVGCPGTYNCFNGNTKYRSLLAASEACDKTPGCDIIDHWKGGGYYLRRKTDPTAKNSKCTNFAKTIPYVKVLIGTEVGCPGGWRCFNGNRRYTSLLAASKACDVTPGCGIIDVWSGASYYLRRMTDPRGNNSKTSNFVKPTTYVEILNGYEVGCPGCPGNCNCLNGNIGYPTLHAATYACDLTLGCDIIDHWKGGGYYLRRKTDPKARNSSCTNFAKPIPYKEEKIGIEVGCPGGWRCFNGNFKYTSLLAASKACDVTPGCDIIDHWIGGGYYLRRKTDPTANNSSCTNFVKTTQKTDSDWLEL